MVDIVVSHPIRDNNQKHLGSTSLVVCAEGTDNLEGLVVWLYQATPAGCQGATDIVPYASWNR